MDNLKVWGQSPRKARFARSRALCRFRPRLRGEVLMLYGESAEWSPKCEVFVDGQRVAGRATSDFGRMFAPTAYLVWKIGGTFDADAEHTLEIRPVFADGEPQEFRLGSICVAGRNAAWVQRQ